VSSIIKRLPVLLLAALAAVAAAASILGPDVVARVTRSFWFLVPGGAAVLAALAFSIYEVGWQHRPVAGLLAHLGLALGLAGAALSARSVSGYIFLENQGEARSAFLRAGLDQVDVLPEPLALDSISVRNRRGFRPTFVCWVRGGGTSAPVAFNQPGRFGGLRLLFNRDVEPGFLLEYELAVGADEYVLLHNQRVRLDDGREMWSFGYDPDEHRVGFMLGGREFWLPEGATAGDGRHQLTLRRAWFALNNGAVFQVSDTRARPFLFSGFGLCLVGIALVLVRRRNG